MSYYSLENLLAAARETIPEVDDDPCDDCSHWAGTSERIDNDYG